MIYRRIIARQIMRNYLFAGCILVGIAVAPQAQAQGLTEQQIQWCENKGNQYSPDLMIGGCTAAIQSGRWSGRDLAWAFYNRGNAYAQGNNHDRAIADYNEAIRLKSDHAHAHSNRALTYEKLGNREQAIADFRRAYALGDQLAADDLRRLGVTP
jgi:tetratricopeptide (TPR) repeat protein